MFPSKQTFFSKRTQGKIVRHNEPLLIAFRQKFRYNNAILEESSTRKKRRSCERNDIAQRMKSTSKSKHTKLKGMKSKPKAGAQPLLHMPQKFL